MSFDEVTKQIELELHNPYRGEAQNKKIRRLLFVLAYLNLPNICAVSPAPVEPGKFDLVYQNADGTERVEYAVSRDSRV